MPDISSKYVLIVGFLLYIVLLMSPLSIKYEYNDVERPVEQPVEPGSFILALASGIFKMFMIYFILSDLFVISLCAIIIVWGIYFRN